MAIDVPTLLTLNDTQLNDTFRSGVADPIPDGSTKGTAIVANGTKFSPDIADVVSRFVWQGKSFDSAHGVLRNRISAFGINAIVAEVYKGQSLAPKLYLGLVYAHNKPTIHFALEFE
jgi:hypothetical protein